MNSAHLAVISIVALLSLGCPAPQAQEQIREPVRPEQQLVARFDSLLQAMMSATELPGAAACVVIDTSVVMLRGYGVREAGTTDSVDANTVFRIASVSKGFASVLTGLLVQDSVLRWDDPVVSYLPEFRLKDAGQTQRVTLRHVLSHTTGLPYHAFTNMLEHGTDPRTLLRRLHTVPLIAREGTVYSYQNVGYSIIAHVIGAATGKSFEEMLRERIFLPLRMTNASADYETITHGTNVALPHRRQHAGWRVQRISRMYYNATPAGGVNASISDMARWVGALLGNAPGVIPQATLDTVFAPFVHAPAGHRSFGHWPGVRSCWYGMGWRVVTMAEDTVVYHGGYVNDYRCELMLNRKERVGVCVMTNAPGELANTVIPGFLQLYDAYRDARMHPGVLAGEPSPSTHTMQSDGK